MSEQLGRCDKKQYEHCGDHARIGEYGQTLPPFPCENWKPAEDPATAQPTPAEPSDPKTTVSPWGFSGYLRVAPPAVATASEEEVARKYFPNGVTLQGRPVVDICLAAIHEGADPLRKQLDEEKRIDAELQEMVGKYMKDAEVAEAENVALRERVKELEDSEDFMRQLQNAKLPCGHLNQYGHTGDGGAHIECLMCQLELCREKLSETSRALSNIISDPVNVIRPSQLQFGQKMVDESVAALQPKAASPEKKEQG